jgi:uncharacterized membrane protein YfcA
VRNAATNQIYGPGNRPIRTLHRRARRNDGHGRWILDTPLLILIFGTSPTTAIGTDIVYSAITKMVGSWRHLKMGTVNLELVKWLSFGSVPAAVAGVAFISVLESHISEDRLNSLVYAVLGGTLLMVGVVTLTRALVLRGLIDERERFEVEKRHKVAAVAIGATTGFVIGITSAGSGTVIAILLIAVYRLAPKRVVGTDIVQPQSCSPRRASLTSLPATSTSASPGTSWSA